MIVTQQIRGDVQIMEQTVTSGLLSPDLWNAVYSGGGGYTDAQAEEISEKIGFMLMGA